MKPTPIYQDFYLSDNLDSKADQDVISNITNSVSRWKSSCFSQDENPALHYSTENYGD